MKSLTYCLVATVLCIGCALGEVKVMLAPAPPIEKDVCRQLCANKALHLNNEGTSQCERGCRFFNIAMNTNWSTEKILDLNSTKDQCCQSCSDAYPEDVKVNCITGCCEMLQLQKDAWLFYLEQQGDGNVFEVEVSLVSDPALWQPSYPLATNSFYKIPQTMLRTMPLRPELSEVIHGKAWTPCTHNNEIPRWLVGVVAVVLTLITIYVSFILPSRSDLFMEDLTRDQPDNILFQNSHVKLAVACHEPSDCLKKENLSESPEMKLLTLNEFLCEEFHVNIPPPPKYTPLPEGDDRKI